jgi:hypothetical protein
MVYTMLNEKVLVSQERRQQIGFLIFQPRSDNNPVVLRNPAMETSFELLTAILNFATIEPLFDQITLELQEDTFNVDLSRILL